jgi:preprotein translocase subunit SecE
MATIEATQSHFDTAKLLLAILILAGGIFGFHHYAGQYIMLYRVLGLLVVASVSLIVIYQTALGKYLWQYMRDSRTEVRKLVKPTRAETTQTTLIVMFVTVVVGLALWGLDLLFGVLIQKLLAL